MRRKANPIPNPEARRTRGLYQLLDAAASIIGKGVVGTLAAGRAFEVHPVGLL
jgi:hypothetical protein